MFEARITPEGDAVPGRRKVHRSHAVLLMARLEGEAADDLCLVCDISPLGAGLKTAQATFPGERIVLDFGDALAVPGSVQWNGDGQCGVAFDHAVDLEPLFRHADHLARVGAIESDGTEPGHRRSHPRLRRCAQVTINRGGMRLTGDLHDISPNGARIEMDMVCGIAPGDRLALAIEDRFDAEGIVRWIGEHAMGVAFDPPMRLWKLEKWLVEGIERCADCDAGDCSAPAFRRARNTPPPGAQQNDDGTSGSQQ